MNQTSPENAEFGARIKQFRTLRRMSLRELGELANATPGFLSQLERGQANASISVLRRVAAALGLTVADLFKESGEEPRLLRRDARPVLPVAEGSRKYLVSQRPLRNLEVYAGSFDPGSSTGDDAYAHGDSQEILLVTRGEITLELDGTSFSLSEGDSIEYQSSTPHRLINEGTELAEILWICGPPTNV